MINTTGATRHFTSPYSGTSFGDPETYALSAVFTDDGNRFHTVRVISTFTSDDAFCDIHDALLDAADDAACEDLGPCFDFVEDSGPEIAITEAPEQ